MATVTDEGLDLATRKRKKGVKQVTYKCERIKKARVEGQQYVNYKGKEIPKKYIGNSCT